MLKQINSVNPSRYEKKGWPDIKTDFIGIGNLGVFGFTWFDSNRNKTFLLMYFILPIISFEVAKNLHWK